MKQRYPYLFNGLPARLNYVLSLDSTDTLRNNPTVHLRASHVSVSICGSGCCRIVARWWGRFVSPELAMDDRLKAPSVQAPCVQRNSNSQVPIRLQCRSAFVQLSPSSDFGATSQRDKMRELLCRANLNSEKATVSSRSRQNLFGLRTIEENRQRFAY